MSNYNIYIDESCHLENDYSKSAMTIGYIKVRQEDIHQVKKEIKAIREKHHTPFEYKWNKVSLSRLNFYKDIIDYFFDHSLTFRCVIIKYKDRLDHDSFNQGDHNNFYYKIIYQLLHNRYTTPADSNQYRVFLDIKDTRGREKRDKIMTVFKNEFKGDSPFIHFQHIRSEESEFIQMVDLFIGAITYKARGEYFKQEANEAKKHIVDYLEGKTGYNLEESTEPWETKFNIFDHQPRKR